VIGYDCEAVGMLFICPQDHGILICAKSTSAKAMTEPLDFFVSGRQVGIGRISFGEFTFVHEIWYCASTRTVP